MKSRLPHAKRLREAADTIENQARMMGVPSPELFPVTPAALRLEAESFEDEHNEIVEHLASTMFTLLTGLTGFAYEADSTRAAYRVAAERLIEQGWSKHA